MKPSTLIVSLLLLFVAFIFMIDSEFARDMMLSAKRIKDIFIGGSYEDY